MAIVVPPIPNASTPLVDADGKMNVNWYRWFVAMVAALKAVP